MPEPLVVSICGPAGTGKSQLAKAVVDALGEDRASRVAAEMFLLPREAGEPLEAFFARPLQWDWALLAARLALPAGTLTTTPQVDFEAFRRLSDSGGAAFRVSPVMLVDAMAPYPGSRLVVMLEVPVEERERRIIERDARWGTRVADRLEHLAITWREASAMVSPHVVLDGTLPPGKLAARVVSAIGTMDPPGKEWLS